MKSKTKLLLIIIMLVLGIMIFNIHNVNAQTAKTRVHIDYPKVQNIDGNSIYIHGWVMSEISDKSVEIYIGDTNVTSQITRYNRPDVTSAVKDFGTAEQNPLAGYKGTVDLTNFKDGKYQLKIKVIDNQTKGILGEATKEIIIKKYKTKLCIDYPKQSQEAKNSLKIHGWVMSEAGDKSVEVYVGNVNVTSQITRYNRPDVLAVIKDAGTAEQNPLAGYDGIVDISNLEAGVYPVKVRVINNKTKEIMEEQIRYTSINYYKTRMCIDYPKQNQQVKNSLNVHGWVMSEAQDKRVEVYIGDKNVTSQVTRYNRPDVLAVIKDAGTAEQNPLAGYDGTIDLSTYDDGQYKLTVKVIDNNTQKILAQDTRIFIIKHYDTLICIDYPKEQENSKGTLKIHGWVMSDEGNKDIKFYFNNNDITDKITRYNRPDVLSAIKGYGTAEQNPLSGFDGKVDVKGIAAGEYTLRIEVISKTINKTIESKEIKIRINQVDFEQGTYGVSGLKIQGDYRGSDLIYYKIGSGPNVFFATFSIHGFEDEWYRDGEELTYIAERFKTKLLQMQDLELDQKWTIYILPCLNPDGQKNGWTKDGPGRTTIYSAAPNNKGVDMNRCWSEGFKETNNDRNYTGPEPFLAYEARYLRNFLLANRSKSGQTVLVDLHGWLNETIGDEAIGSYYKNELGITGSHIYTYGKGYLVNWARTSLGNNNYIARSSLIELEPVSNHQELVSKKYDEKYINATLKMLRGIV